MLAPGKNMSSYVKNNHSRKSWGGDQVVEYLPGKYKALC